MTPKEAKAFAENAHDAMWRVCESGMYQVLLKDKDGDESASGQVKFYPNAAQLRFINRLHYRNLILKARRLGFTTVACIMWLDHAMFTPNVRCGIIAQGDDEATAFFRDKVRFVYDNLDPELKEMFPLDANSANEIRFKHNNSSIKVATSFASGNLDRLLISEYGKICAKNPDKAAQIVIGTIPTVPLHGIIVIESTGEGSEGDFYKRSVQANNLHMQKKELGIKDYRFHFYSWWDDPDNQIKDADAEITPELEEYFDRVGAEMGYVISRDQKVWYAQTLISEFQGDEVQMYSQFPSTPTEPFFISSEGNYYIKEMAAVRKSGRICKIPKTDLPVNVFADIGNKDGCALIFHQQLGLEDRFIDYYEAHGEKLGVYAKEILNRGYTIGNVFLPHDAFHERLGIENDSTAAMLEKLGVKNIKKVDKIDFLTNGIQMVRANFSSAYFDEIGCAKLIHSLDNYKKKWNSRDSRWSDEHDKSNGCDTAADALRQWAQAKNSGKVTEFGVAQKKKRGRNIFNMSR